MGWDVRRLISCGAQDSDRDEFRCEQSSQAKLRAEPGFVDMLLLHHTTWNGTARHGTAREQSRAGLGKAVKHTHKVRKSVSAPAEIAREMATCSSAVGPREVEEDGRGGGLE